jgi:hypothetical protein
VALAADAGGGVPGRRDHRPGHQGRDVEIGGSTSTFTRIALAWCGIVVGSLALVERAGPAGAPARTPGRPDTGERERVRALQHLIGLHGGDVDGVWGPTTRNRCLQQMVGSPAQVSERARRTLVGNDNKPLVRWVQAQLNRKFSAGLAVDGIPGAATHRAIVRLLGEVDGVVGPRGYRTLVLD